MTAILSFVISLVQSKLTRPGSFDVFPVGNIIGLVTPQPRALYLYACVDDVMISITK